MNYFPVLLIFSYICGIIFIVAFIIKALRYARMPLHLRWELYPVVAEKDRPYGGSYYEDLNWWHKPRKKSNSSELTYMISEVLLFKEYFHRNRAYWYFVYPFHIGIFLFVIWLVVMVIQAVLMIIGTSITVISCITGVSLVIGLISLIVGTLGTIGIIIKRLYTDDLRGYTSPIDIFDLVLITAVFISGICAWSFSGLTFSGISNYLQNMFTVSYVNLNIATIVFIVLLGILFAYMPFSKMMHYLAKYFTYHKVRWDDEPYIHESHIDKKIQQVLQKRVSWSAPHIQSGSTWIDIVNKAKKSDK